MSRTAATPAIGLLLHSTVIDIYAPVVLQHFGKQSIFFGERYEKV